MVIRQYDFKDSRGHTWHCTVLGPQPLRVGWAWFAAFIRPGREGKIWLQLPSDPAGAEELKVILEDQREWQLDEWAITDEE